MTTRNEMEHGEVAIRVPASAIVAAYQKTKELLALSHQAQREAVDLINSVLPSEFEHQQLSLFFAERSHHDLTLEEQTSHLKCHIWNWIIRRLRLDACMTSSRQDELRRQLTNPSALPEITEASIWDTTKGLITMGPEHMREIIQEAFDLLHPRRAAGYVTNERRQQGETDKIILCWILEPNYRGGFNIRFGRPEDNVAVLDRAFHLLDGQSFGQSIRGPLHASISSGTKEGQTSYFRWKGYVNGNLHLWILRKDLLNQMYGILDVRNLHR